MPKTPDLIEQDGPRRRRLQLLMRRIEASTGAPDPGLLHQLGDLHVELREREEALTAYGRAIDGFLEAGKPQVTLLICTKVLTRFRSVVRTHFTYACVLLNLERYREAADAIKSYVDAALLRGTTGMAIPRLRFLAGIVAEPSIRTAIGVELARLGDSDGDRISRGDAPSSAVAITEEKRKRLLLDAARWGSDAVWSSFWLRW